MKEKYFNLVRFVRLCGKSPAKELEPTASFSNSVRLPIDDGKVPSRLLSCKYKRVKLLRSPNEPGIVPSR